jgi:DNA replication protein DnaC
MLGSRTTDVAPKPYACDACRDTGFVENPDTRAFRKCDPCSWRDAQRGFAPGVPADEHDARLSTYDVNDDNRDAVKHASFFIAAVHPGLYLHGGVGVGKTRLACVILNECHARGDKVLFTRAPELLLRMQRLDSDRSDEFLDRLLEPKVLVLDDLGASQGTDFARRTLQTILDGRLDRGHRTVFTSNLSIDQLGDFMEDDRLPSRISGTCKVVALTGNDQRRRRRKASEKAGQTERGW